MKERRSSRRWRTADYNKAAKTGSGKHFAVYNRADDGFIGYLADISSEGIRVLSKKSFSEGTILKIRVELPEEIKGSDQLIIEAKNIWCEPDTNPEYNQIGFSFTYTFPHHAEVIDLLFKGKAKTDKEKPSDVKTPTPQ
jgi:hypothetical protein